MNEKERKELGARVLDARLAAGLDKEPAARAANVSSITWTRVEEGEPVRDTSLAKVLRVIGRLDQPREVAASSLASIPDAELLAEIARRFARTSERTGEGHAEHPATTTTAGSSPADAIIELDEFADEEPQREAGDPPPATPRQARRQSG